VQKVKRIDMAVHIQEICALNKIKVNYQSMDEIVPIYWANKKKREIQIRPTKNTGYYVSALHEIGHIIGDNQDLDLIAKELWAWIYAKETAMVWTPTAERIMRKSMDSYGWEQREKIIWEKECAKLN
tara:strand:- start:4651 stop:5031 length:381 start_codon:yes stop_codon:yes gene_type:complete